MPALWHRFCKFRTSRCLSGMPCRWLVSGLRPLVPSRISHDRISKILFDNSITLAKEIPINEGTALRFRADAINVLNRVNLGTPNTYVDSVKGGIVSRLGFDATMRVLQFTVKFQL